MSLEIDPTRYVHHDDFEKLRETVQNFIVSATAMQTALTKGQERINELYTSISKAMAGVSIQLELMGNVNAQQKGAIKAIKWMTYALLTISGFVCSFLWSGSLSGLIKWLSRFV